MLKQQRGQIAVAFALVLTGCMLTLFIAALDLQALSVAYNRADTTALLAAQAGASAIDANYVYNVGVSGGPIILNQTEVNNRCRNIVYTPNPPRGYVSHTCKVATASSGSQYVVATIVWDPLFPVGLPGFTPKNISLTRNGYPAFGCRSGAYVFSPLNPANCS